MIGSLVPCFAFILESCLTNKAEYLCNRRGILLKKRIKNQMKGSGIEGYLAVDWTKALASGCGEWSNNALRDKERPRDLVAAA